MAVVPEFEHDVFVSYAHDDNKRPTGTVAQYGWVTALAHNLNARAGRLQKDLFIDHQLKPGDPFSEDLRRKVKRSALLLIFLSQNYVESSWCGKELEHFIQTHGDDPAKPLQVFVVELCPYESLTQVPENIAKLRKALIHAQFWYQTTDHPFPRLAGDPSPQENDYGGYYWLQLDKLCDALDGRLRELKRQAAPVGPLFSERGDEPLEVPALSTGKASPAVLLADVTDDLVPQRNEVKFALEKEGIRVLPEGDYVGRSAAEFSSAFARDAKDSLVFVQMLSTTVGRTPSGGKFPLPQLQFAAAQEARLSIMQWCQAVPEVTINADPTHHALFKTPFLYAVNLERFKEEVIGKYRKLRQTRETPASLVTEAQKLAKKWVFIDDLVGDKALSQQIRTIVKHANCAIRSLPKQADEGVIEDVLKLCRGGITVYSDRRDHCTVYARLNQFINHVAERDLPLSRWGVYFGPPPDKEDLVSEFGLDSEDIILISGMDSLNEAGLLDFLQSL